MKKRLLACAIALAILQIAWSVVEGSQAGQRPPDRVRITSTPPRAQVLLEEVPVGTTPVMLPAEMLHRFRHVRPVFRLRRPGWIGEWQPTDYDKVRDAHVELAPTLGPLSYVLLYPLGSIAALAAMAAGWLAWRGANRTPPALREVAEIGPGGRAGPYRLVRSLGCGAAAEVFLGHPLDGGTPVAVKIVHADMSEDAAFCERLEREGRMAARLHHPNIVSVLDHGVQDGRPYLVMELVEGTSLRERLDRVPVLSLSDAVRIGAQVCDALSTAHAAGIVHRDLKPGNILLAADGTARVTDFGVARSHECTSLTSTDALLGTPAYLPPEQVTDSRAGPSGDIYSLGCVLFEMLTGRTPFTGTFQDMLVARIVEDAPPLRSVALDIPPVLDALVAAMLSREPEKRPPDGAAVKRELLAAIDPG